MKSRFLGQDANTGFEQNTECGRVGGAVVVILRGVGSAIGEAPLVLACESGTDRVDDSTKESEHLGRFVFRCHPDSMNAHRSEPPPLR